MAAQTPDADILAAAYRTAEQYGLAAVTRPIVSRAAGISLGGVSSYPGGMDGLRAAVVARMIERADVKLLAQALAAGHPGALAAPAKLREAAGRLIAGVA